MDCPSVVCLTSIFFTLTYAGLALGKIPGLRMDRAGIALVGATLMLVTGVLTLQEAVSPQSIDYETLILLLGMMIVVGCLRSVRFLPAAGALVPRPHRDAQRAAGRHHPAVRRAVGVSGQRHRVPGPDAVGAAPGSAPAFRSGAAPDRPGDGGQHRLDRHHHRQSAEHDYRHPIAHFLPALRGQAVSDRRPRSGPQLPRHRLHLSSQPDTAEDRRCRRRRFRHGSVAADARGRIRGCWPRACWSRSPP